MEELRCCTVDQGAGLSFVLKAVSLRGLSAKEFSRQPFQIWQTFASFRDAQPHDPLLDLAALAVNHHEPNRDQAVTDDAKMVSR